MVGRFDERFLEEVKSRLRPSDVIGRLRACKALGKRKTKKAVEQLQQALNEDEFFGVRQAAADALSAGASA